MTIFTKMNNGKYPTVRFMKSVNEEPFCIAEISNVQFYRVSNKTVEIYTFPTDKNNKRLIKNVDFIIE